MSRYKSIFAFPAMLLLLVACADDSNYVRSDSQRNAATNQTDNLGEADVVVNVNCSFSVNGNVYQSNTKADCDDLRSNFEASGDIVEESTVTESVQIQSTIDGDSTSANSVVQCSFNVNGQSFEGNSQAECDKLKADLGIDFNLPITPPSNVGNNGNQVVQCSFNVNGTLVQGNSQAECDKLKADLGINNNVPALPPSNVGNNGNQVVQCSFNVNGTQFEGNSKAECDKLKNDLGISI